MDDERPSMPLSLVVFIGILAVIGLISVFGWVAGAIAGLIRLVVVIGLVALAVVVVRAVMRR
ncbi:MAG: hypothetical protein MUF83_00805 [Acidimicrobiales bacterium]|nr:hypothetical protein [Acidimicrobiales bacterium]